MSGFFDQFKPHVHKWTVLDKTVLPSGFEQMAAGDIKPTSMSNAYSIFIKKVVVVLACTECGKLDKTVESNP